MYLLTFIVLLISVLGLYANVAALQAGKIAERQKSIAEIMLTWHQAAYRFAIDRVTQYPVATNPGYTTLGQGLAGGCLLNTPIGMPNEPASCDDTKPAPLVDDNATPNPMLPIGATNYSYYLPGYNSADYRFNSIVFQPAGDTIRYVITFVTPPNADDATTQINFPPIGFSTSEIQAQLRRANISAAVRGAVTDTCLPPLAGGLCFLSDSNLQYPLPTGLAVTRGSVGLYSIIGRLP